MTPRPPQREGAQWALMTVRRYGLAYLIWQERTGKTLTALLTVESSKAQTCLIVTKKKAIGHAKMVNGKMDYEGWLGTLKQWSHKTTFEVINYESVHKMEGTFDFIILDEAHHAIASIGRTSKTWKAVFKYTKNKPILYLSATPYAETVGQLYHQFKLSNWSPWLKFKNYYDFHREYGIPKIVYTAYGPQQDRSVFRVDDVLATVSHLFNFKTRKEVGIKHEPTVNVIIVPLHDYTKQLMKEWVRDRVIIVNDYEILGDSDSKMRIVHYQLEGGTVKIDNRVSTMLHHHEKVDYIRDNYEEEKIAIMAHFIQERVLLEREFPKARILSSDGDAEGVDLSDVEKLIVYSLSFKTSKHAQRTARQANHNREIPIEVDILVADKPAVGLYVYNTVAIKKENFVKSSYERSI